MNSHAIRILFLKDLFLSRRPLFAYFAAGLGCSVLACVPHNTLSFLGFILVITIAIAAGMHLIGSLLLSESIDHTRLFVMSLPVSLLDYSVAKISVVLITYLMPWSAMLACLTIFSLALPGAKPGAIAVLPAVFFFLLAAFTTQLATAVVTESVGWTVSVLVAGNVSLNVFLMKLYEVPEIARAAQSDVVTWPPQLLQLLAAELAVIVGAIAISVYSHTRKRDLL